MSHPSPKPHYLALDGLRGWAAFAVVIYHVCLPVGIHIGSKAYLAVDFFFLMSGLVVAKAYEAKLRGDLTLQRFAGIRLRRLYPLFALGMAMGGLVSLTKLFVADAGIDLVLISTAIITAFLLIPLGRLSHSDSALAAFPLNSPAWSLFFEFAINAIYAVIVRWLSNAVLAAIILFSAVALTAILVTHGALDVGGDQRDLAGGLARVSFSFFLGVGVWRLHRAGRLPTFSKRAATPTVLLLAVLMAPGVGPDAVYDGIAVFVAFPIILVMALSASVGRCASLVSFAGAVSYPIYITHYPIMRVFQYVFERWNIEGAKLYALVALELVVIFGFAVAALYLFDKPLQRLLRRPAPLSGAERSFA